MLEAAARRAGMSIIVAAMTLWCAWYVYQSSFVIGESRYFCLFDDAMISMTYAKNVVAGHGLSWAREGPRVEGFTSPLWLAAMVLPHLFSLPERLTSLFVQGLACLFLVAHLFVIKSLCIRHFAGEARGAWVPAVVLTAFYVPLLHWSLQGMETAAQVLLLGLVVHWTLDLTSGRSPRWRGLSLVLVLCTLLRHDMWLTVVLVLAFVAVVGPERPPKRFWQLTAAALVLVNAAYLAFRWSYFGELLPNTYYLKMTGVDWWIRVARGLDSTLDFLGIAGPVILIALLGAKLQPTRRKAHLLLAALVVTQLAYTVWIGGDVHDNPGEETNRFVAVAMPLVFVSLGALIVELPRLLSQRLGSGRPLAVGSMALATLVAFIVVHGLGRKSPLGSRWPALLVLEAPLNRDHNLALIERTQHLSRVLPPEARVATVWAGVPAYFSEFRMLDLQGYNDHRIARMKSPQQFSLENVRTYVPGHVKRDLDYSLGQLRPHAVLFYAPVVPREQEVERMTSYGYVEEEGFWARPDLVGLGLR